MNVSDFLMNVSGLSGTPMPVLRKFLAEKGVIDIYQSPKLGEITLLYEDGYEWTKCIHDFPITQNDLWDFIPDRRAPSTILEDNEDCLEIHKHGDKFELRLVEDGEVIVGWGDLAREDILSIADKLEEYV